MIPLVSHRLHGKTPWTYSNLFSWRTLPFSPTGPALTRHTQSWSTWTSLYRDTPRNWWRLAFNWNASLFTNLFNFNLFAISKQNQSENLNTFSLNYICRSHYSRTMIRSCEILYYDGLTIRDADCELDNITHPVLQQIPEYFNCYMYACKGFLNLSNREYPIVGMNFILYLDSHR